MGPLSGPVRGMNPVALLRMVRGGRPRFGYALVISNCFNLCTKDQIKIRGLR